MCNPCVKLFLLNFKCTTHDGIINPLSTSPTKKTIHRLLSSKCFAGLSLLLIQSIFQSIQMHLYIKPNGDEFVFKISILFVIILHI